MKQHFLRAGNERLTEASPLDAVCCIEFREDDFEAIDLHQKIFLGKLFRQCSKPFAQVRPAWHTPPFLVTYSLRKRPMEFVRSSQCHRLTLWLWPVPSRCPLKRFGTCFSVSPASNSPEILAVAPGIGPFLTRSEHGSCFGGYTITLDDAYLTIEIAVHGGADALAPLDCVALLDSGSPHTRTRRERVGSHGLGGCHIRSVRAELCSSILGGLWRVFPPANVDEHFPVR